jgi:transposase
VYNVAMQDIQLYQQILGDTRPWRVERVILNRETQSIEVEMTLPEQVWACPACQTRMHVHGYERRRWRHLDSCQYRTILTADVPRVQCDTHGTQAVQVPWAEKHGRFTALFERLAIDILQASSTSAACDILRISWDEADGIKQRAVRRGLARKQVGAPLRRLCVDEKSFGRGQDYVTVVVHAPGDRPATVEHISDGRTTASLNAFWQSLTSEQLAGVEAVGMDLWEPYWISTVANVPEAAGKIVHDPYHLVSYLNKAVNIVRQQEHRVLHAMGDDRLSGTKQLWLYGIERLPPRWQARWDELRGQKLQTGRAWAIKEMFRDFWTMPTAEDGRLFFKEWYAWAIRCGLQPIKKVAKMMKAHLENILTFFVHRLSNASAEGLNNLIQGLIKKAYGYRNRERFKTDILFHAGGLDLYPVFSQ